MGFIDDDLVVEKLMGDKNVDSEIYFLTHQVMILKKLWLLTLIQRQSQVLEMQMMK